MKTYKIVLISIGLTLLFLLFPEVANHINDGNSAWMGFIGAYVGCIFGGIASGIFTYLGVFQSLNAGNRQKFIDEFPQRLLTTDKFLEELRSRSQNPRIEGFANGNGEARYGYGVFQDICDLIREESVGLDVELYREARKTREFILDTISDYRNRFGNDFQWGKTSQDLDSTTKQRRTELVNKLSNNLDEFVRKVSTYRDDIEIKFERLTHM